LRWLLVPLLAAAPTAGGTGGAAGANLEYQVKAAFLYNFAKFVGWPAGAAGPFVVCIAGDDPFGASLEEVLRGKAVNGRAFVVRRLGKASATGGCHILFVSGSERKRLREVLGATPRGVLTVGDCEEFAKSGGIVGFTLVEGKVRFEVNIDAAGASGLKISAQMLSLAKLVHTPKEGA